MLTQPCVLIVESDPHDLFLIKRVFVKSCPGCEVFSVASAEEAIRYLIGEEPYKDRRKYPLPRLLLVDLKMHGMGGFDLLEWLKTRPDRNAIAVVMLTGSGMPADLQKAMELGADDYYVKPQNYGEMEKIACELATRHLRVSLPSADVPRNQLHPGN
jgi:CheY-like chemotaxis protein